jgi:hypothetical protein
MEGKIIQDEIWICAGCGKLPKNSEHTTDGTFSCSRCGKLEKVYVSSSDYSQTSSNLESNFFKTILEKRLSGVERVILSAQIDELPKAKLKSSSKTKKKSAKKSVSIKPIKKSKKSSKSKPKKR